MALLQTLLWALKGLEKVQGTAARVLYKNPTLARSIYLRVNVTFSLTSDCSNVFFKILKTLADH